MSSLQTFDGLTLAYQVEDAGYPVVLLHGFAPDTDHDWRHSGLWHASCHLIPDVSILSTSPPVNGIPR